MARRGMSSRLLLVVKEQESMSLMLGDGGDVETLLLEVGRRQEK